MRMIKLILLIISVIAKQVYCDEPEAIIGGDIATSGQFKYQVSLQSYGEHFCGGTIISTRHILTAAHCVDDIGADDMVVVSGTNNLRSGGIKHDIKSIQVHPDYTGEEKGGWKNDIAIIALTKPLKINNVQAPIPLASKNYVNGDKRGIVSGWGRTKIGGSIPFMLRWVDVNVLSLERCLRGHKNPPTNINQICTLERVGKGACQGDSGGPLVVDDEVVGVVSWVLPCALGVSDVFTNVYNYLDFITESMN